jgi:hypothetical protein
VIPDSASRSTGDAEAGLHLGLQERLPSLIDALRGVDHHVEVAPEALVIQS